MTVERTLSIVKPDGVRKNVIGDVYRRFEESGLSIVAARMTRLTTAQAEAFYAIHRERPFFRDLVGFMTSGSVMVQVLEGADAVAKNREIMGATDPKKAAPGDPRRPGLEHRSECRARLGQRRERRRRSGVLLRAVRDLRAEHRGTRSVSMVKRAWTPPPLTNLLGLTRSELEAFVAGLGEKPFRARQLMKWMYRRGVGDVAAMTDLGKEFREQLAAEAEIRVPEILHRQVSSDGTQMAAALRG